MVRALAAAFLFLLAPPAARAADSPGRPNILFIYTDDQSYKTLRCYPESFPWAKTPNIDALARSGVRFHRAPRLTGHGEEPYPDFVALAKGFRCGSRRVSRKEDLDAALEEMLDSKGAYVLDVLVPYQEHVLPMIPGGMTVRDMIKA